jgi:Ca2+-binding EF-hand superfamily protein
MNALRLCCELYRKKMLESTFAKFDADGNGFVTLDEASDVLKAPPFKFPPEIVKSLLQTFDKDGNGKLDYHEFAGFYAEAKARFVQCCPIDFIQ